MTYLVTMGTLFCQMERPGRKIRRKLLTTDDLEQAMVMVGDRWCQFEGSIIHVQNSRRYILRRRIAKGLLYHSHKL